MEIWIIMWMLQYEEGDRYQPRQLEIKGTLADCNKKTIKMRTFYMENDIKYGNMYCVKKEEED